MSGRNLAIAAIVLWVVTALLGGFFFVKGQSQVSMDGRLSVTLAPAERDLILAEMRMLLEGVQGITAAAAAGDMQKVAVESRRIGMASAADLNPALMMKLPLAFKQQGMKLHGEFDRIAERAEGGATATEVLELLAQQLSSCVSCHSSYRLEAVK